MHKLKFLIYLSVLSLFFSCAGKTTDPVGPSVSVVDPNFGNYVKIETWIADFDAGPPYNGDSVHFIAQELKVPLPFHNYVGPGSSTQLPVDSKVPTESLIPILKEATENGTNAFFRLEYVVGDDPSGAWEYHSMEIPWTGGPINANNYGNAFAFRARGTGNINAIVACPNDLDSNSANKSIVKPLSSEWQEYVLLFSDMSGEGDLTRCSGFSFTPPAPSDNIGISGFMEVDDIRFVYYYQKK